MHRVRGFAFTCLAALAFATTAGAQPYYEETFDADLGAMIAGNDGQATNGWAWDSTCPAAPLADHSAPGTAHWTNPTTCLDYGTEGSSDRLSTGRVEVPCSRGVVVTFNYYLDFAESASCDRARVEYSVDGVNYTVAADNGVQGSCFFGPEADGVLRGQAPEGGGGNAGIGNLQNSATWTPLTAILSDVQQGDLMDLAFIGETSDGLFNSGQGFFVDDVALACVPPIQAIPTLGPAGLAGLVVLLAAAGAFALVRRRRQA